MLRSAVGCQSVVQVAVLTCAFVPSGVAALPAAVGEDCGFAFVEVAAEAGIDFRHDAGASGGLHLPETMGAGVAWIDFDGDGWLDLYFVQSGPFPPAGEREGGAADRLFRNLGPDEAGKFRFVPVEAGGLASGYGQGVVAADVDGDRDFDLLVSHWGPTVLLRNDGAGRFAPPEPLPAGGARGAPAESSSAGDAGGAPAERLPAGGAEGAPDESLPATGAGGGPDEFPWGSSMALADADGDGDLDLYVSRYLDYDPAHGLDCRRDGPDSPPEVCDPSLFTGQRDRYYANRGDGAFEDATEAAGLGGADGKGLGVLFTDLDADGRPDLYVANDLTLNLLFRNRGDGTFEDLSLLSGAAVNRNGRPEAGMGLAAADFDLDGDPDLAVTNFDVETNTLYRNAGPASGLLFEDVSATTGFGQPSFNLLGFGIVAADFDRDGALDVYVANGHIFASPRRDNTEHRQRNLLLRGHAGDRDGGDGGGRETDGRETGGRETDGRETDDRETDGRETDDREAGTRETGGRAAFVEARCGWLERHLLVSRGAATADFDLDGDADLAVTANDGPARLWRNDAAPSAGAAWLGVELRGAAPNTQAVGAVVTVSGGGGAPPARRWTIRGDSYQSSSGHRLRWALAPPPTPTGDPPAAGADRTLLLDLRWPSGARTRVVDPPTGVYLVVEERP